MDICHSKLNKICESKPQQQQNKFRRLVLNRFNNKCPISGHRDTVDACHILERKNSLEFRDKGDLYNGILLSKTLHCAFDKKIFTIDENTCCIKILNPNHTLHNIGLEEGKYIWQLDNEKSKYYLQLRNEVFNS